MRQWNDNEITLTADYKLVWNLVNLFPNREGQTEKGRNILLHLAPGGILVCRGTPVGNRWIAWNQRFSTAEWDHFIHTRHFDAQYCDKKDIFEALTPIGQGKLLTNHKSRYFMFR